MSPLKHSNNLAARMGRWSANHWTTAVFGWLAFVVCSVKAARELSWRNALASTQTDEPLPDN